MGTINQRRTKSRRTPAAHKNWMGGNSFEISPVLRLRVAAASCFFGEPQYYHRDKRDKRPHKETPLGGRRLSDTQVNHLRDTLNAIDKKEWRGKSPAEMLESAIDDALDADPKRTLMFAEELRQKLNIRTTPQVIMVRAAKHPSVAGTPLLAEYGNKIMQRLDEPTVQLAYYLAKYGKPIPSRLKRAWQRRLESAKDYEIAKYKMQNREVNLYDLVNLVHANSPAIDKLMKGTAKQKGDNKTWESVRSEAGKVEKGSREAKKVWTSASKSMGHMALLRNLRNLEENGALTQELLDQLVAGVEKGRQLPFRYYAAFKAMSGSRPIVQDTIETCIERAFRHAPHFEGRTMVLSDNSGSAHGTLTSSLGTMSISEIGNLMAVMTARMSDEGWVGLFGDNLRVSPIRKKSSIFDQVNEAQNEGRKVGMGTENGIWLFWRDAIQKKQHWDNVFIYSDMQAGHGGLYGVPHSMVGCPRWGHSGAIHIDVPKLIREYRSKVNDKVNVYLIQTAGYQDTLVPEFYDRTYILGGWSEHVLQFAEYMNGLRQ